MLNQIYFVKSYQRSFQKKKKMLYFFYIAGSVISKLLKRMNRLLPSVKETTNAVAE